ADRASAESSRRPMDVASWPFLLLLFQLAHPFDEGASRARQPHPDVAGPRARDLGDALARQTFQLEQDESRPVLLPEPVEDPVAQGQSLADLQSRHRILRDVVGQGARRLRAPAARARPAPPRPRPPAPAPPPALDDAHGDLPEPGRDLRPAVEARQLFPHDDEHVLHHVLAVAARPEQAAGPAGHRLGVVPVDGVEGRPRRGGQDRHYRGPRRGRAGNIREADLGAAWGGHDTRFTAPGHGNLTGELAVAPRPGRRWRLRPNSGPPPRPPSPPRRIHIWNPGAGSRSHGGPSRPRRVAITTTTF